MSLERWVRLIAGTFIIASVALSYFQSRYWLWFTLFVGLNLFQSALTRWCLMEDILRKFGIGRDAEPPEPSRAAGAPS
jgi:Inner membrane protein YgaP-like, transmembrane domain